MSNHLAFLTDVLTNRLHVPDGEVTGERTLEDLGLDSIAFVELALAVERALGVSVTEDEISPFDTVDEVVALLAAKTAPHGTVLQGAPVVA